MIITLPDAVELDPDLIKPFVKRWRAKKGFDEMKATIRKEGLKIPIEVRDISERPPDKRRRPDGGTYRYELIKGEGRLMAHKQLRRNIPALIIKAEESAIPGRFLAENVIRRQLSRLEMSRLIKADLDDGLKPQDIAKKLCTTVKHVVRLSRIIKRTPAELEEEMAKLSIGDAELVTSLPEGGPAIVIETMRDTGERKIKTIVNKAREVIDETGKLSKTALNKSLQRVKEDLHRLKEDLKVKRRHDALGPQNLELAFSDPIFRAAAIKEGVNVEKFEKLIAK